MPTPDQFAKDGDLNLAITAINNMAAVYGLATISVQTPKNTTILNLAAKTLYDKINEAYASGKCKNVVDLTQISEYKIGDIIKATTVNNMEAFANNVNSGFCSCYCNNCSCDCARCSCNCDRCSCNCNNCSCNCAHCRDCNCDSATYA